MWGLSSPTRDWTSTHCIREQGAFTFGIPGKSLVMPFSNIWDTQLFTQSNLSIFSFMIYSLSFLNRNFFSATPSGRHARSPGIELTPPAVEAWSLKFPGTREVPGDHSPTSSHLEKAGQKFKAYTFQAWPSVWLVLFSSTSPQTNAQTLLRDGPASVFPFYCIRECMLRKLQRCSIDTLIGMIPIVR